MLSLTQKQSQQQRLTPQQLQYLKLLQLSGVALEQRVKEELEINPLLEEIEPVERTDSATVEEQRGKDDIEWDDLMAGTWDPYRSSSSGSTESIDMPQPAEVTLIERILAQLRLTQLSTAEIVLAEEILGNIDADGYLRRDLADIVADLNRFVAEEMPQPDPDRDATPRGPFSSYDRTIREQPFGRDRLIGTEPIPTNGAPTPEPTPQPEPKKELPKKERTIADLTLEEMAELPIEELARILERGTMPEEGSDVDGGNDDAQPTSGPGVQSGHPIPEIFTLDDAERILHRVQRLDPPAIGSRSLQENLAIQLELIEDPTPPQKLARRLIQEAYHEFTMKHFEKICRRLDCTEEELREAIEEIIGLNPKPGEGSGGGVETNYVTPDFVIERDRDEFLIIPNDAFIPTLRINPGYREMLGRKGRKLANVDRGTQKFLRQKMESAKWFIASIHQRRQTMLRVMEAILEIQGEFFRKGPDHLKPMIYRDIAEKIGMDISTVCRVVNGKYVQTDFGVFELRYFFSEALETAWGEEVSNKVVKTKIREMIESEDKGKPLSDEAISEKMQEAGYSIARRTVAKYREQMNIPIARLRRSL